MDLLKSLKSDLKQLKLHSIQSFQQLKNNPNTQISFDLLLNSIQSKIDERIFLFSQNLRAKTKRNRELKLQSHRDKENLL